MIISRTSYFRTPPTRLKPKQVLIFNGIRYSLDICDFSFERLESNLYKMSFPPGETMPAFPIVFSDVWTIINNATIFYNIASRLFNIKKDDPIFKKIQGIELLRHSQQHLDERIDEVLLEKELPIYGSLSWYAQQKPNSTDGAIVSIDSGTITHRRSISTPVVNPEGRKNDKIINDIDFSMAVKINKEYEVRTIKINTLMTDLLTIINHFEKQLANQLMEHEPTERHINDLIIRVNMKRV